METGERIELTLIQGQEPLLLEPCSRNLHARLALQVVLLILSVMPDWLASLSQACVCCCASDMLTLTLNCTKEMSDPGACHNKTEALQLQ
jgi:hypothetical protein